LESSNELTRKKRRAKKKRKTSILIGAIALTAILAVGALFVTQSFSIKGLIGTYRSGADIDAQVDYFLDQTPELFTDAYGGHSPEELRQRFTDSHMDRNLLAKEARRRGIGNVDEKVESSLGALKSSFSNSNEFEKLLADRGITEKQLRATLEANILINELAKDLVKESDVTEEQAKAYFEANIARYSTIASKRVSHILFASDDLGTASAVHEQLVSGADYGLLAKEYSKDAGSAKRAGDIGWSTSTYPDAFQSAVDVLEKGDISTPVVTEHGIHIIKVTDTRAGSASFEASREQVMFDLLGALRAQAINTLLHELKG